MKNFLTGFPSPDKLVKDVQRIEFPEFREVNAHIHTPYSFSAFPDMETIFEMAKNENIAVLGINDFYVTDGYDEFHKGCLKHGIFPIFNIEFIGLMIEEQKNNIRINDPNNPGRIYFCGKGLDYPFETGWIQKRQLKNLIRESQKHVKAMTEKLNGMIKQVNPSFHISYELIKNEYAHHLVRERHIAKALRIMAQRRYPDSADQVAFLEKLYGKKSNAGTLGNAAVVENEIRSNLLKSGGGAFVEEDENAFLELKKIIKIIINSGGIPCYPVLLDDPSGRFTEFESDKEKLYTALKNLKVECIELIPSRNDINILRDFVNFFNDRDFIVTFGTEHNTPELVPMKVTARGGVPLDEELKKIAYEGACIIAAHQYLRAEGRQGYVLSDGRHSVEQKKQLIRLGQIVIEYYLKKNNETRTNRIN